jgi:DNA-binding response OmpR family regulator
MMRVLLVEDDDNERFTLTRVLERAGFEVEALPRGAEALAALARHRCDAVITDLMMPGVDGLSLARRIHEQHPDLPIVFTSAFPMCRAQLDRLDIATAHFLAKPIDIDRLLAVLRPVSSPAPSDVASEHPASR